MISFDNFAPEDGVPIYQQVVRHVKRGIVSGQVQDGDELPSRRTLSALLGLNPNTVQKACSLLEEEGLIVSRAGAKSAVCLSEEKVASVRKELLEGDVAAMVAALKEMGLTRDEALALIGRCWN